MFVNKTSIGSMLLVDLKNLSKNEPSAVKKKKKKRNTS